MKEYSKYAKNQKLRNIRTAARVTQDEIAEVLGMTRSAYQHLETKGNLSGDIIYKLSRFFSCPMEEFIEDSVEPATSNRMSQNAKKDFSRSVLSGEEKQVLEIFASLPPEKRARALGYLMGLGSNL